MFSFNELINCFVYFFISAWKIFLENEKPQNEGKKYSNFASLSERGKWRP